MACPQPSLLAEFKSLEDELKTKNTLYCRATTDEKGNPRCGNRISNSNKAELRKLVSKMISTISSGQTDMETILGVIASLVLCRGSHQPKAEHQKAKWVCMIQKPEERDTTETREESQVANNPVYGKPVNSITKICDSPENRRLGAKNTLSSRHKCHSSDISNEGFDDPGYNSEDDKEKSKVEGVPATKFRVPPPPVKSEFTDDDPFIASKSLKPLVQSKKTDDDSFTTPKKPLRQFFVDSGVSMGYATPQDFNASLNAEHTPPSSPLHYVSKQRAGRAKMGETRPSATPIQSSHREIKETTGPRINYTGHKSTFRCFSHPAAEMIKCIKKPLGKENLVDGYLYVFQISGPNFYKIGYTKKRDKNTIEESFELRMIELRKTWPDLQVVFQCRLPHAQRAEQILHKHFAARRLKETSCERARKEKASTCRHKEHREWFDVPLNEIWKVACAWCHWIKSNPYPLQRGEARYISQDWITKLDAFDCSNDIGLEPGYYWLEWLHLHIPQSDSLEGLNIMELNKIKRELERLRKEQESKDQKLGKSAKPAAAINKASLSVVDIPEGPSIRFLRSPVKQGTWTAPEIYEREEEVRHKTMRWALRHLPGRR